jgi:hypothetical protein
VKCKEELAFVMFVFLCEALLIVDKASEDAVQRMRAIVRVVEEGHISGESHCGAGEVTGVRIDLVMVREKERENGRLRLNIGENGRVCV